MSEHVPLSVLLMSTKFQVDPLCFDKDTSCFVRPRRADHGPPAPTRRPARRANARAVLLVDQTRSGKRGLKATNQSARRDRDRPEPTNQSRAVQKLLFQSALYFKYSQAPWFSSFQCRLCTVLYCNGSYQANCSQIYRRQGPQKAAGYQGRS